MVSPGPVEQAVSNFVDNGLYPEDENVITAELPSSTLQSLGKLLDRARADVKISIRELSRLSAPDIDGWITQAKQLKDDIDNSVALSEEITQLGEDNAQLQEETRDAGGKVKLLQGEVAFNRTLVSTLEMIQQVRLVVNQTAAAISNDSISDAVSGLSKARAEIDTMGTFGATTVTRLLGENIDELQQKLHTSLDSHWARIIVVDSSSSTIKVHEQSKRPSFDEISSALAQYDLLAPKIIDLWRALDSLILGPWLARRDGKALGIDVQEHTLSLTRPPGTISMENLFRDVKTLRDFFQARLPTAVSAQLSGLMMPSLLSRLVSGPLQASVPPDLGGIPSFVETLNQVSRFEQDLRQSGWNDVSGLSVWVTNAPNVWLQGRNADSLNSMRQLLKRGLGNPRAVERVETQTITENDDMLGAADIDDDWDAGWEEQDAAANAPAAVQSAGVAAADEDEENAWGWDEEGEQASTDARSDPAEETMDEDGGGAWGWGDEEKLDSPVVEQTHALESAQRQQAHSSQPTNGGHAAVPTERTVTLRELYHITALPESILELIIMVVEDADSLSRTSGNPVAPAAKGLYTLTSLLLAMYRASAPEAYAVHESGNMFLYNDSQYLAEQLRLFASHHASRGTSEAPDLSDDIAALETFGKRAYSKEMESQRIILGDMLDGAQSFVNCTDGLRAGQCDLAVTSVIDRIQQVNSQWKGVLSPSALLQSTGSLLSTVIGKIILDIEDMNDIQESESKALTAYCSSIESLESLFLPQQDDFEGAEPPVPLTAGYVPSWLKFQYLSNILDSSLVDIKYLWTEGSLSLEFEAEEVVDLIEGLFADSPRRKEAIAEIRRTGRR